MQMRIEVVQFLFLYCLTSSAVWYATKTLPYDFCAKIDFFAVLT